MTGRVSKIVYGYHYGFIMGEDDVEYFFHRADFRGVFDTLESDIINGLKIDVIFKPSNTPKGPRARSVLRTDLVTVVPLDQPVHN